MEPVSSASIKAVGSIASALISRYRPVGVARTGSPEDRAQAYRRFLDATTAASLPSHWIRQLHGAGVPSDDNLVDHLLARQSDANVEMACALDGIRLCAPEYVITKAEEYMAIWSPNTSVDAAGFKVLLQEATNARIAFLNAARHDLDYNPKWWQFLARRRERAYLKAQKS
ncbi:hypothetical protein [Streptomyces sp. NPDC007991]|uniref:hypothetical protein n=1 Tax=Streptomyces sp. NPDC007991 TaxID=3364803 RepID=UPI0036E19356